MRKFLKHRLPHPDSVRHNRWLRPLSGTLLHPRLWHLNRHSAAGAVAVGLFCGLIPGPFQMLGAALCCVVFRVNLPLALVTTLYTNPFTIVPLYLVAFTIGTWFIGDGHPFTPPPQWHDGGFGTWVQALIEWMIGLGAPLVLGLVLLGLSLAALGYVAVRGWWRWHLVRAWHRRKRGRSPHRR
ncbi:DUF2062 domain-containing protein [Nitrogeniibacter mangrovi]|uniref:DUF2062 domain-containing protein n=1 Tax=Nitrogeniibacter mangrovi TaxID=2016596 RepID=A0A6C1B9U4_9RHOO|nr:DUF2062 domain-containing protein [Nitrogeniibacter mangrovi]QID19789.1 DUF2062 domain-containing protein [Nitrogeniibacter mangrovi]